MSFLQNFATNLKGHGFSRYAKLGNVINKIEGQEASITIHENEQGEKTGVVGIKNRGKKTHSKHIPM